MCEVSKPQNWWFKFLLFHSDKHLNSSAAGTLVQFLTGLTVLYTNLAASRLCEIYQNDILSDNKIAPLDHFFHSTCVESVLFSSMVAGSVESS